MPRTILLAFALALCVPRGPAAAQDSWPPPVSFSLRGEFAVPVGGFATALGQDVGFGVGVQGRARVGGPLSIYAGWDRFRFVGGAGSTSFQLRESGFRGGVQLTPRAVGRVTPFVLAGPSLTRVSTERTDPDQTDRFRSPHQLGYEIGGGLALSVSDRFWFVPEARYRSRRHDVERPLDPGSTTSVEYLGINLGLLIRIP